MGNSITYRRRPGMDDLDMSNGLTSVVLAALCLASSALARTDRQRELAVWFASHDQAVCGLGVVGFDVSELPWSPATFADDRAFLLATIEAAKAKTGWDRLGYTPREDWILDSLERFNRFIAAFDIRDAETDVESSWSFGDRPESFELCPEHAVYRHSEGCLLCNDR